MNNDFVANFGAGITPRTIKELKDWNKPENSNTIYWTMMCIMNIAKDYERHNENLIKCRENQSLIKFYYNINTSLKDIEERVERLKLAKDICEYLKVDF